MSEEKRVAHEIEMLTTEAIRLVRRAEKLAKKYGVAFDFSVAYGMGGYYMPDDDGEWEWLPSSRGC